ncbi:hypothetical protein [Tepidiforma sp.]|uniref:hypothetical protein n=1 Tax=Tepidiforma sp. TaxID=2682230 RepID=UPI002637350C|nr:hypothetical protein [Tepidiforma sp.]MCX7618912.1 hypothetical protein [Tepidiforma sp.]
MPDHAHHWLIATPDGSPFVEGRCRACGATRLFSASGEGLLESGAVVIREPGDPNIGIWLRGTALTRRPGRVRDAG